MGVPGKAHNSIFAEP